MISNKLEPFKGFTRAYKIASKLNTDITYSSFYKGVKDCNPVLFRLFYEATLNGVPNKQLKQRIINYGNKDC